METLRSLAPPHKSAEQDRAAGRLCVPPSVRPSVQLDKLTLGWETGDQQRQDQPGDQKWREERRSSWIRAESAHSGWELRQEGGASDWPSASDRPREADPSRRAAGTRVM